MKENDIREDQWYEVLPVKNIVLFPGVLLPVAVSRPKSLKLIKEARKNETPLIVLTQRDDSVQEPTSDDLYPLGTVCRVVQIVPVPDMGDDHVMAILEGVARVQAVDFQENESGIWTARPLVLKEKMPQKGDKQFIAAHESIRDLVLRILSNREDSNPQVDIQMTLRSIGNGPTLVNYVCAVYFFSTAQKEELLAIDSLTERATAVLTLLEKENEMMNIKADIRRRTHEAMDKQQRDYFLQQEIETIKQDLGDTGAQTIKELRERAQDKRWSEVVQEVFNKELQRLEHMPTHSPDFSTQLSYLELMLELPWGIYSEDNYDMKHAQEVLNHDHFGLDKVKERVVEYLAVQRQLGLRSEKEKESNPVKSPILCLYGPPGVGKTSLGKSVAEALGRKYARISLGGLHDEAEIRGHRRTYIGALPGRIIDGIKKCGTSNPVFVLDEIDKIGADYKGDPTSALLEVLDPEQNSAFHDNYLDVDYDLSHVLFIATANSLDTVPRPLLDRMELIEMTGYLQEEKEEIAKRHLIPKELKNHGLKPSQLKFKKARRRSTS